MMKPRLFDANAAGFTNNGRGTLIDATSCIVTQTLNGQYELAMQYPITGRLFGELTLRRIIVASVDPISAEQPFRIYRITQPLQGLISIYARHIAYDLDGIVDAPFTAASLDDTLAGFVANATGSCPFTFGTDKSVSSPFELKTPSSIWGSLSGREGSLLDVYGGEFEFDGFQVYLHNHRGQDNGVSIAYGKNLTTYQQDQNNSNVYTGVFPFWTNEEELVMLPEQVLPATGTYDFERILSLDLSEAFEAAPTEAQLRARAEAYMSANEIGVPKVSWTINFVMLEQSEEYHNVTLFTRIRLGDTVHVFFPRYSVTASARAVTVRWNALLERYESITLGSVKANLAQTIAIQQKETEQKPTLSRVEQISAAITAALLGARDGAVRLLDTNGDGSPDELYIADNPDPALARKVWRWNYEGWAASTEGYLGPWTMGATLQDGILANAVTAANLTAGTIVSADGHTFKLNLDTGELEMDVQSILLNGTSIEGMISDAAAAGVGAAGEVQDNLDILNAHIKVNSDGSVTFVGPQASSDDTVFSLTITSEDIKVLMGDTVMDTFGLGGTITENLTIPTTGALTMHPYKWVSRSNGHLQLVFVG